jgi:Gpi18-like mannosyltransferase
MREFDAQNQVTFRVMVFKISSYAGTTLWNNILQREGNKSTNWESPFKKFLCPTREHPYLLTYDNS